MIARIAALLLIASAAFGGDAGRVVLTGRAVAADGTAADFAELTADCKRVVCTAGADGTFRCATATPAGGAFCVEHPRFGRKRIELDGRTGAINLGVLQLVDGATIRVVRPLHVEVPEGTTVSLLRDTKEVAEPQVLGSRELIEFAGVQAGKYEVLLAGREPLQRKVFPIEVAERGETEIAISIDAYRLTGNVERKGKPLASAKVSLQEAAWETQLETDQSGRFSAELWAPGDYAVSIEAGELSQPYVTMKAASTADVHWSLDVPARTIAGRIFDSESGRPVAHVSLLIESDDQLTRSSRTVPVNEDGTFDLSGAGTGRYVISARAPGYLQSESVELQIDKEDGDRSVDLPLVRGDRTVFILPRDASFAIARVSSSHEESGLRVVIPDGLATLRIRARVTKTEADACQRLILRGAHRAPAGRRFSSALAKR
jgi:hypothetical protein